MKTCTKCRQSLKEENFHKRKGSKDGLRSRCKACHSQDVSTYNATHREKKREYDVKYHAKYYVAHRAEIRVRHTKYRALHRAEYRRHQLKRRYKEKLNKGKSYAAWERKLRAKKTFVCYWCNEKKPIRLLNIDHIVPISKGGVDGMSNVVPSCVRCNYAKHNKNLKPWAASAGMLAI